MARRKKKKYSRLHMSIGVAPTPDLNLTNELNLMKVALLYSDKATLCSPKALMLASIASLATASFKDKIDFIQQVMPVLQPEQAEETMPILEMLSNIAKKKYQKKMKYCFK